MSQNLEAITSQMRAWMPSEISLKLQSVDFSALIIQTLSDLSGFQRDCLFSYYRGDALVKRIAAYSESDASKIDRELERIHLILRQGSIFLDSLSDAFPDLVRSGVCTFTITYIDDFTAILSGDFIRLWSNISGLPLVIRKVKTGSFIVYDKFRLNIREAQTLINTTKSFIAIEQLAGVMGIEAYDLVFCYHLLDNIFWTQNGHFGSTRWNETEIKGMVAQILPAVVALPNADRARIESLFAASQIAVLADIKTPAQKAPIEAVIAPAKPDQALEIDSNNASLKKIADFAQITPENFDLPAIKVASNELLSTNSQFITPISTEFYVEESHNVALIPETSIEVLAFDFPDEEESEVDDSILQDEDEIIGHGIEFDSDDDYIDSPILSSDTLDDDSVLEPDFTDLFTIEPESIIKIDDLTPKTRISDPILVNLLNCYMQDVGSIPLLGAEEEAALAQIFAEGLEAGRILDQENNIITPLHKLHLELLHQSGVEAKHKLIEANLRLVISIAKKHIWRGLDFMDLIQEGTLGLIRAIEKFDLERKLKLSTYATWWIKQALNRAIADQARTIRLPVHMVEKLNKVAKFEKNWLLEHGVVAPTNKTSRFMDVSTEDITQIHETARLFDRLESIECLLNDNFEEQFDSYIPYLVSDQMTLRHYLDKITFSLKERELLVLQLRHGWDNEDFHTLEEIGQKLNITRERVRQIEKKAERKLKYTLSRIKSHLSIFEFLN
jgi:RNA polymerase primary sigma factor